MSQLRILRQEGALLLKVVARPGASRSEVVGILGDALKIAVRAPPERGRANEELCAVLSRALGLGRGQVRLARGQAAREKLVEVEGLEEDELRRRIGDLVG